MSVSCEYCVLSGRGLCDELITPPEESYRLCVRARARVCVCVCVCDLETPTMGGLRPSSAVSLQEKIAYKAVHIKRYDCARILP
jgi:hypothetical protein